MATTYSLPGGGTTTSFEEARAVFRAYNAASPSGSAALEPPQSFPTTTTTSTAAGVAPTPAPTATTTVPRTYSSQEQYKIESAVLRLEQKGITPTSEAVALEANIRLTPEVIAQVEQFRPEQVSYPRNTVWDVPVTQPDGSKKVYPTTEPEKFIAAQKAKQPTQNLVQSETVGAALPVSQGEQLIPSAVPRAKEDIRASVVGRLMEPGLGGRAISTVVSSPEKSGIILPGNKVAFEDTWPSKIPIIGQTNVWIRAQARDWIGGSIAADWLDLGVSRKTPPVMAKITTPPDYTLWQGKQVFTAYQDIESQVKDYKARTGNDYGETVTQLNKDAEVLEQYYSPGSEGYNMLMYVSQKQQQNFPLTGTEQAALQKYLDVEKRFNTKYEDYKAAGGLEIERASQALAESPYVGKVTTDLERSNKITARLAEIDAKVSGMGVESLAKIPFLNIGILPAAYERVQLEKEAGELAEEQAGIVTNYPDFFSTSSKLTTSIPDNLYTYKAATPAEQREIKASQTGVLLFETSMQDGTPRLDISPGQFFRRGAEGGIIGRAMGANAQDINILKRDNLTPAEIWGGVGDIAATVVDIYAIQDLPREFFSVGRTTASLLKGSKIGQGVAKLPIVPKFIVGTVGTVAGGIATAKIVETGLNIRLGRFERLGIEPEVSSATYEKIYRAGTRKEDATAPTIFEARLDDTLRHTSGQDEFLSGVREAAANEGLTQGEIYRLEQDMIMERNVRATGNIAAMIGAGAGSEAAGQAYVRQLVTSKGIKISAKNLFVPIGLAGFGEGAAGVYTGQRAIGDTRNLFTDRESTYIFGVKMPATTRAEEILLGGGFGYLSAGYIGSKIGGLAAEGKPIRSGLVATGAYILDPSEYPGDVLEGYLTSGNPLKVRVVGSVIPEFSFQFMADTGKPTSRAKSRGVPIQTRQYVKRPTSVPPSFIQTDSKRGKPFEYEPSKTLVPATEDSWLPTKVMSSVPVTVNYPITPITPSVPVPIQPTIPIPPMPVQPTIPIQPTIPVQPSVPVEPSTNIPVFPRGFFLPSLPALSLSGGAGRGGGKRISRRYAYTPDLIALVLQQKVAVRQMPALKSAYSGEERRYIYVTEGKKKRKVKGNRKYTKQKFWWNSRSPAKLDIKLPRGL